MKSKFTKQNGITLIALIITIIVMLILVGVTINVAMNGSLFEKARTAATKTEEQQIYEEIISSMVLNSDSTINVYGTYNTVKTALQTEGKTITPSTLEDENAVALKIAVTGKTGETFNYILSTEEIAISEEYVLDGLYNCLEDGDDEEEAFIVENGYIEDAGVYLTKNYIISEEDGTKYPIKFTVLKNENGNIINKIIICSELFMCVTTNQDVGTTHLTVGTYYLGGDSGNSNDYIEITRGEFYDQYKVVIDGSQIEYFAYGDDTLAVICINNNIYNRDGRVVGTYNQATNTIVYQGNSYTIPSV